MIAIIALITMIVSPAGAAPLTTLRHPASRCIMSRQRLKVDAAILRSFALKQGNDTKYKRAVLKYRAIQRFTRVQSSLLL